MRHHLPLEHAFAGLAAPPGREVLRRVDVSVELCKPALYGILSHSV